MYGLSKVAQALKKSGPYHHLSRYDSAKTVAKVYTILSNKDLVVIKKRDTETYVTITQKGEDLSEELLKGHKVG